MPSVSDSKWTVQVTCHCQTNACCAHACNMRQYICDRKKFTVTSGKYDSAPTDIQTSVMTCLSRKNAVATSAPWRVPSRVATWVSQSGVPLSGVCCECCNHCNSKAPDFHCRPDAICMPRGTSADRSRTEPLLQKTASDRYTTTSEELSPSHHMLTDWHARHRTRFAICHIFFQLLNEQVFVKDSGTDVNTFTGCYHASHSVISANTRSTGLLAIIVHSESYGVLLFVQSKKAGALQYS